MEINDYILAQNNFNLYKKIEEMLKKGRNKEIIFLCVGNPKIWFDSFGPIIGSILKHLNIEKFIYGNTLSYINAENIESYIKMIYGFHTNPFIIVFDNALSNVSEPTLKIKEGEVKCASLSKNAVYVGDYNITYCLNKNHLKDNKNYFKMIKEIKNMVRILYYAIKDENLKNAKLM